MDGLNKMEALVFMASGKIISLIGWLGLILVAVFDPIAGRRFAEFGPAQGIGIAFFSCVAGFGMYADNFLNNTIKPMIKSYLQK